MTRPADDFLERELIPGWTGEIDGVPLTINRLGMRDRADRQRQKPAGTCRIAAVGSSVVMGYGVRDDEPFPLLLEERLNASPLRGAGGTEASGDPGCRYEVLNFGSGRSQAIHRHVLVDRKVFAFEPDAIYYFAHQDEFNDTVGHLARLLARGREPPYPGLIDVVRRAGITPDMTAAMKDVRLQPLARDVVLAVYRDLVEDCRRRRVLPVWIYLPVPGIVNTPADSGIFAGPAAEAGFAVVDLSDWPGGRHPGEVKRSEPDHHPNALGHRLIAERLYEILRRRPELLPASDAP
jgi:hypothetical protein